MMKAAKVVLVALVLAALTGQAVADPSLAFSPSSQTLEIGNPLSVDLVISGLGDHTYGSTGMPGVPYGTLGAFFIDIGYDPTILDFTSATGGTGLDAGFFGTSGLYADDSLYGPGILHLDEVSFEFPADLDAAQPGSFVLATLNFDAIGRGTSPLTLDYVDLGDSYGYTLPYDQLGEGSVTVTPVPGAMLLGSLGLGVAGWLVRRKETQVQAK